jgi:uncharacterized repeat protein (TIGR02543 family)
LTVTFDSNDGTAVANGSVATNATLAAPAAPTRTGYTFVGWSTAEESDNGTLASLVTFPYTHGQTADFTLHARWTPLTYTITFAAGSAAGATAVAPETLTKTHDSALTLPNAATANAWFTRSGFEVVGWSVNANGTPQLALVGGSYTSEGDATLYPVWSATTRTVTYETTNSTGGSAPSVQTVTYNTSHTVLNQNSLVRAGYTFAGWNTAANGTGTARTAGQAISVIENIILYPQWTANTLTVTFDSNGGTTVANGSVATAANLTAPTAPTRIGYTFVGWSTAEEADNGTAATLVTFPYAHPNTANFTLRARWTANTLTVTFDSNGGTAVANGSVATAANLTAPTAPTRVGFVFAGWSTGETNNNGNLPVITFPYAHPNTANFILYARWTALDVNVTYAAGGATGTVPVQAAVASGGTFTVATASNLNRSGFTFTGWSDGTSIYQPGATYTVGTSAVTLTAQWAVPSGAVGTPVAMPTNVVGSAGNASATVTWQITVGAGELTPVSYVVEFSTDGGRTWSGASVTGTGLSRTVTGLRNGTSYVFRVTAVATNSTATSAQSAAVTPVDPTPVVVPDPVSPTKRVTVGTFNGFIAIYTVGYEGSRMTARVAGRWLTVNPITHVAGKNYSLTRRNTGAGFNVNVQVYIDGQLITSTQVRTR